MIEISLALLGTAAVIVAAVLTERVTNRSGRRGWIVTGHVLAVAIIWGQYIQQLVDDRDEEARHAALSDQNRKLSEKLDPILQAAQAKHPGISESEAVEKLLGEIERLNPQIEQLNANRSRGPSQDVIELHREAYTQTSLALHYWKNVYIGLNPELKKPAQKQYDNVWSMLRAEGVPRLDGANWTRYRPMFEGELQLLSSRLQDSLSAYDDVISASTRTLISRTRTQLESSRSLYHWAGQGGMNEDMFRTIFISTFDSLGALDSELQRLKDALPAKGVNG